MASNLISDKLSEEGVRTVEVEAKPTDRELEFAKVTEITEGVREEFLANKAMSIEEAVSKIQDGLTAVAPPAPAGPMPGLPGAMPMGMPGGGGPPEGSGDIGSILDMLPQKL